LDAAITRVRSRIPGDRICSFIERVEHIDEEIKALNEGKKEVFAEARVRASMLKSSGKSFAYASRTRRIATNKTPYSTCISGPWKAPAPREAEAA
jgi:hypothetical protein